MRPWRWTARLLLGLLVCWSTARAVPGSTELRGQVADENGVPVAGVEVHAQDATGIILTAQSDKTGHFSFQNLAPGPYRINLSKPGFYRLETSVTVPAEGLEASYVVNHESEVHEKLEVHSTSDQIEPQTTPHHDELLAREVRNIPVPGSHVLQNSLLTLPTVLLDTNGAVHVAGGRTPDTVYLLDGFEFGDPITGALTARIDADAVRDVDVESGNLHAGSAHATAGVMTLDTATGDDRWRFAVTNFIPGLSLHDGAHLGNWYPRLSFSGPLEKGRIWFSDAISLQHTYNIVTELPPGSDTSTQWSGDNLFRVQFNLTPRHVLQGSFLYDRESDSDSGLTPLMPLSATTNVSAHRTFGSLKDQIWFQKTLIEIGLAADTGPRESVPQGSAPYVVTPTGSSGNYFEQTLQRGRRWQAFGNVISPSRHWHGTHQWAVGLNAAALAFEYAATRNEIDTLRQDGTLQRLTTFSGLASYRLSNTQVGAYAQDTWQAKKWLVVQAGVRVDRDRLIGQAMAEPRIAVNVLPKGGERAKLSLGWGMSNQPLDLSMLGQGSDQRQRDVFYDSAGQTVVGVPTVSQFVVPMTGLRQPRFQTESAEWKQKLGSSTLLGVRAVARDGRDGFDYAYQPTTSGQAVFLLQNSRRDRYRAGEVSLRHSFGTRAEVFGSYTRSSTRTNTALDPALGALLFAPQAAGPLPWDAPNRLLAWGWTPLPVWKLILSSFFEYRTGFPFSEINQQQQLVGAPGSQRFPPYASLNLGLEREFRFRQRIFAVRAAAINLSGRQNPDTVVNNTDAPNFRTFSGGQRRALTFRLRFVGKK
jgi:Carboxypeptidase regulatory-like domain